jgi:glyoxylase-like metal-dependent hydrolase (beta-lactamase superfamily II)
MTRKLGIGAVLALMASMSLGAQDARTVIANASKAMGVDSLTSISYSGTAQNGNFGQNRSIAGPLEMTGIANYTRAIDFSQPASRATGDTAAVGFGQTSPQPGRFNQIITPMNQAWAQQLQIWVTPWGFLKGASANAATLKTATVNGVQYNVVTWSPAVKAPSGQSYRVAGYINPQNLVERVETWVESPVVGDQHVDTVYSGYKAFGGLQVPTIISQRQAEVESFVATVSAATANPGNIAQLLTPPPPPPGAPAGPPAGGPPPGPPTKAEKMAEGVYRITGNYVSLAIDMGDHVLLLECGFSEQRCQDVINTTKQAIPNKPIRYVVTSHMHVDHASGLATAAANGAIIVTQNNNKPFLEWAFGQPRTLVGDMLSKSAGRKPVVEGVGEQRTFRSASHTVEVYHMQGLAHTDGMLISYLPKEKILFAADFNAPAMGQYPNQSYFALNQNVERLKLNFETYVPVHTLTPDRTMPRSELFAALQNSGVVMMVPSLPAQAPAASTTATAAAKPVAKATATR